MRACVNYLGKQLASRWYQLPKSHLLCPADGELVIRSLSKLHILHHTTPCDATRRLGKDGGHEGHLRDNVSVGHIPNEHLAVKRVPRGHEKSIVVREGQVAHFVIVLREPINSLLLSIVPDNDV